jgi:hypothetical protein
MIRFSHPVAWVVHNRQAEWRLDCDGWPGWTKARLDAANWKRTILEPDRAGFGKFGKLFGKNGVAARDRF